nr:integrase core domain-containing protein [Nitrosovibrio sp. Nv17]
MQERFKISVQRSCRLAAERGWPKTITVDNGTEFTSRALDEWAYRRGIKLDYTRPGKPTDNGLIESCNGRLRDEFLNVHEFITLRNGNDGVPGKAA